MLVYQRVESVLVWAFARDEVLCRITYHKTTPHFEMFVFCPVANADKYCACSTQHMGLSENRVYSQWNSHLIGIMISKTIGFRGTQHFQTHPYWFYMQFVIRKSLDRSSKMFQWSSHMLDIQSNHFHDCLIREMKFPMNIPMNPSSINHPFH